MEDIYYSFSVGVIREGCLRNSQGGFREGLRINKDSKAFLGVACSSRLGFFGSSTMEMSTKLMQRGGEVGKNGITLP